MTKEILKLENLKDTYVSTVKSIKIKTRTYRLKIRRLIKGSTWDYDYEEYITIY